MKALLTVFALVEVGAGLTLVVAPSALTALLVGTQLDTPTASIVGRVAEVGPTFPRDRLLGGPW